MSKEKHAGNETIELNRSLTGCRDKKKIGKLEKTCINGNIVMLTIPYKDLNGDDRKLEVPIFTQGVKSVTTRIVENKNGRGLSVMILLSKT